MKKSGLQKVMLSCWLLPLFLLLPAVCLGAGSSGISFDMLAMQGIWVRTDAPYRLEISQGEKGEMKAKYFNRKYINVEETTTASENGAQLILVKLKDVNYDGSFYVLKYERSEDTLVGIYVLGGTGQRFKVSFIRNPADG